MNLVLRTWTTQCLFTICYNLLRVPFQTLKLSYYQPGKLRKIKSLKLNNSHGYDEISIKLLKISSPFIISTLTHTCNKSLSSGIFPDRLKYSEIKPLLKKGDKLNISNYTPISILSSFSKVLEKFMYIQLCEQSSKNILAEEQFGFRTKSTTNNAIYRLTNDTLKAVNNKLMVGGIFCDLGKVWIVLTIKSYYLNWNFTV
jgi:hypothetical protein